MSSAERHLLFSERLPGVDLSDASNKWQKNLMIRTTPIRVYTSIVTFISSYP